MGSHDDNEIKTQNDEWFLCISNFDSSSLPENKKSVADVILKKMVDSLNLINLRTRIASEFAYYEETAWMHMRSEKAKAIASKQNERSLLMYKGDSRWIYRRNLEKIDNDLKKLYLELEEIGKSAPVINSQPVFGLIKENLENKFPAAPAAGNEYRFCLEHKSDALLTGTIYEFYDRFVVSLKLYTIFKKSFIWEESVIFSQDDIETAIGEYTRSLIIALSGNEPAVLAISVQPDETLLLINGAFAGRGETSVAEYPPGTITVNASAPDYKTLTFETELIHGERTDIEISLKPVEYVDVEITGTAEGRLYHGALYVGEAPLTLRLPSNQMEYIELETPDKARSSAALHVFGEPGINHTLILPDAILPVKGLVDKARRNVYLSWAGTWIAGTAAWLSYNSYINSNSAISTNYAWTGSYNKNFYDKNNRMYYVSMGTLIMTGVTVALDIFFINRYITAAGKGNTTVTKTGRD
jgi:hypothetical protein